MDFFIIANAWSAGKDNPTSKHRIALELVRQGHRVLWIEGSGMRTPSVGSSSDRLRMVRKVAASLRGARRERQLSGCQVAELSREEPLRLNPTTQQLNNLTTALHILSPLFIPLPRYELVRRLNGLIGRWVMRFWGWRLGFSNPVLINYVPVLAEAMRGLRRASPELLSCSVAKLLREESPKGSPISSSTTQQPNNSTTARLAPRVVYHCVDRWDAFAMYDSAMMGDMDRRCCRYADLVIASAGELYDRCHAINPNTVLIPHGVDWEHFRRAAVADMPLSSCQTAPCADIIGFFGLLSEWVDQELLLRLAREFPGATVQLIGKADVDVSRLKAMSNIQLTGPKPFAELPDLIARFTVGIIPFVVNDLTRAVNPIKLREMLSAGCPVVSTALPEVARCVGDSRVAHSHDEFVSMVGRVLAQPLSPKERVVLSDSMAGETWSAKVQEILKLL